MQVNKFFLFNIIFLWNAPSDAKEVSNKKDPNYASFETKMTSEVELIQKKTEKKTIDKGL